MTLIRVNRPEHAGDVDALRDGLLLSIQVGSREHYGAAGATGSRSTLTLEEGRQLAAGKALLTIKVRDGENYGILTLPDSLTVYTEIGAPKASIGLPKPASEVKWSDIRDALAQDGIWTGSIVAPAGISPEANPLHAYNVRVGMDFGVPQTNGSGALRYNTTAWRFYTEANEGNFRVWRMPEEEHLDNNLFYVDVSDSFDDYPGFEGVQVYIRDKVYDLLHNDSRDPRVYSVWSQIAHRVVYAVIEKVAKRADNGSISDLATNILRRLYDKPTMSPAEIKEALEGFKDDPKVIDSRIQSMASVFTATHNALKEGDLE